MIVGLYTLFLICLCLFVLDRITKHKYSPYGGELTLSDTSILKGIAILMVVLGHIGQAVPGLRVFTPLGATGVGVFLLCSGYGIEKSFEQNGRDKYWYKRIIKVWLPYAIVELMALPLHWNLGWQDIVADFVLIKPLHPFGWYMRFLFLWYILFWAFSFTDKFRLPLLVLAGLIIWAVFDSLHAQNAFSFTIGVALARVKATDHLWKRKYMWIGVVACILLFFVRDYIKNHNHDIHLLWNGGSLLYYSSLVLTVLISYKFLSSKITWLPYDGLYVIGAFSYELYLVHGYAYCVLVSPASMTMVSLFFIICIVGTYLLNKLNKFIISIINDRFLHQ